MKKIEIELLFYFVPQILIILRSFFFFSLNCSLYLPFPFKLNKFPSITISLSLYIGTTITDLSSPSSPALTLPLKAYPLHNITTTVQPQTGGVLRSTL